MKTKTRKAGCLFSLIKLLVLTIIIAGVILYFSISLIVPPIVHYAGKAFGIDMGLGSFSFAITEQAVELKDFYINNPEGFKEGSKAINLNRARLDLGLGVSDLLLKDLIVIDEIIIEGFEVSIEYAGGVSLLTNDSNLNALVAKLKSEEAKQEAKQESEVSSGVQSEKEYKLIIKKIVFKDGKVGGGVSGVKLNLPLHDFEILDVGVAEGGVSPLDASLTILSSVSYQAMTAVLKATGGAASDIGNAIGDAASDSYKAIKSIFDGF